MQKILPENFLPLPTNRKKIKYFTHIWRQCPSVHACFI